MSKRTKPRTWTEWRGFTDGRPDRGWYCTCGKRHDLTLISKTRREVARHYQDVRRVRITELLPKPRSPR